VVADTPLVLLVEQPDAASTLEGTLNDEGWRAVCVGAVADAMERAKREQPFAIVFRGAPDDAIALVKKLRCNAHTACLPAVVVTDTPGAAREELARWGVAPVLGAATADRQIADAVRAVAPLPPAVQVPDAELGRPDRLRALERANLLDTPPEEAFDRLTQFTAQLLNVPIVLMSVLDSQRQFIKAQFGLPEPVKTTRQTPLSYSFCQWVVTADDELVVDDVRCHQLLSANRATLENGVVAYAGVPLRADADETIGSFCAVDMKPHRWDPRELRALHDAADVAEGLTALRQAARLPPVTFDEFRGMAGVAGHAIEAAMRLHEAGQTAVATGEQHALLAIASDLGRQLARLSGRST
jgi:hypothetical protein